MEHAPLNRSPEQCIGKNKSNTDCNVWHILYGRPYGSLLFRTSLHTCFISYFNFTPLKNLKVYALLLNFSYKYDPLKQELDDI